MLVDPSISRVDVSKTNPSATRPAIGAHARRPVAAQGVGKRRHRRRRHGIPAAGMELSYRGRGPGAAAEEEGRGAASRGGVLRRGGAPCRGDARW
jgi:hypothetical protein